jgi:hypothetical protein
LPRPTRGRLGRDPRFLRHRGHRFITLRRFADAEADLERAARLIAAWASLARSRCRGAAQHDTCREVAAAR